MALLIESLGADGITVHPRPDQRHIRNDDIYKLKNSHILQKYSLPVQDYRWISDYKKSQKFDVDKCAELDGSIIGFKIIIGNQLVVENLAMNIDCIGNNVYESNFLNQLSKTIKQFELGKF